MDLSHAAPAPSAGRGDFARALLGLGAALSVAGFGALAGVPDLWVSALLGGVAARAAGEALAQSLRDPGLRRVAVGAYAVASLVGAFVLWDNHSNTGLLYAPNFDESFYYHNARRIADLGLDATTHWTLFDVLLAGWCAALGSVKELTPADALPLNWALTAVCAALAAGAAREAVGSAPPLRWQLAVTLAQAQVLVTAVCLFRDMLVAVGFVGATLFALRRSLGATLACVAVAGATRGGHGFLAALVAFTLWAVGTRAFARNPRTYGAIGAAVLVAAVALASTASSRLLSGRVGEDGEGDVAAAVSERTRTWTEGYAQTGQSLGARVMGLGPVGYPLRMVSGYFAPVVLRDATFEKSLNSLFLPGSMGDRYTVRGHFLFTYFEWLTALLWPVTAPILVLGMTRLAGGTRRQRALLAGLAAAFLAVMVISMQERHRVAVLALNPVFAAAALARPWTPAERRLVRRGRGLAALAVLGLNLYARLRVS